MIQFSGLHQLAHTRHRVTNNWLKCEYSKSSPCVTAWTWRQKCSQWRPRMIKKKCVLMWVLYMYASSIQNPASCSREMPKWLMWLLNPLTSYIAQYWCSKYIAAPHIVLMYTCLYIAPSHQPKRLHSLQFQKAGDEAMATAFAWSRNLDVWMQNIGP